jgi:hypothetical protein
MLSSAASGITFILTRKRLVCGVVMNSGPVGGASFVRAFLWLGGLVGAASAVIGVLTSDGAEVLIAIGTIGGTAFLLLAVASVLFGKQLGAAPGLIQTLILGGFFAAGIASYVSTGSTFTEEQRFWGVVFGVIVVIVAFVVGVVRYQEWERTRAPARKPCPDCANEVLAAANVCQHCGFRFGNAADPSTQ